MSEPEILTTASGIPVADNQNSLTAGPRGPVLMQDFHLIEKMAHFNRERIPERVVHAKGAGACGAFTVTGDITRYTKAAVFSAIGKKTEVMVRFSTVGGEKGSADSARDPRGFATKFYTEEGNWDLVGNNTPVFFIRDALKFGDFIHTRNERVWVKFHLKTKQGIQNLTREEAVKLAGENPDHATQDLFEAIERGEYPKWRLCVQIMPESEAETYYLNPFDLTKVWPHSEYLLIEVGELELNRNPENYFAEVEQA